MMDGCFHYRGPRQTQARVVLIGLDDLSLDDLGKPLVYASPEFAEVVSYVKGRGAAAIGLDVIVPESLGTLPEVQRDGSGDRAGRLDLAEKAQGQAQKLGALVKLDGRTLLSGHRVSEPEGRVPTKLAAARDRICISERRHRKEPPCVPGNYAAVPRRWPCSPRG